MGTAARARAGGSGSPDPESGSEPTSTKPSEIDEGNLSADAVASLDRLLSSESLVRAPRIRSVLRFLVEALKEGRTGLLNEQAIGQAVFERPASYNPGEDNIVRVTMRHLRERLEEYYRTEGRNEKYLLVIPKGKYVPCLIARAGEEAAPSLETAETAIVPVLEHGPVIEAAPIGTAVSAKSIPVLPWILVLALSAMVIWLALRQGKTTPASAAPRNAGLFSLLLGNGRQTTVVVTDSNLEAYRIIFRRTVSLDAYLARSYMPDPKTVTDPVIAGAWHYVSLSSQTSVTSSIIASEIQAAAVPQSLRIKHPHDLSMRDFQHDNFILLGGPWIDPWGQLFEDRLNFRFIPLSNAPWLSQIHNTNPLPNEKQEYAPHQRNNGLTINYARIALMRNLRNDGYVILLGATSEEALEAGGRFITNPQQLAGLLKAFNAKSLQDLPSFEVVIEVAGLESVPEDIRIVAERAVKPQSQ